MKSLLHENSIIHLDAIAHVEFDENDSDIVADDQCAVFFIGSGNDPWLVRGEKARPLFERLAQVLNAEP